MHAVCRGWRAALDSEEADEVVWRSSTLRTVPWFGALGQEHPYAADDDDAEKMTIEERKQEVWGRPAVHAPIVPKGFWKKTLKCTSLCTQASMDRAF